MTKIFLSICLISMMQLISCEETTVRNQDQIEGTWIFKEFFLGDAIMTGCGWEAENVRTITLTIEKDGDIYKLSGAAPVNNYFGSAKMISFQTSNLNGKIEMGPIGSTKMAGPQALMQCETMFLDMLQNATDIGLRDNDELHIGRFRTLESNPRDGGTYMIFEKAKSE
jgi:heat shock protein HslJ